MTAMTELLADPNDFLHRQQERIKAPNTKIAASMIVKRYAKVYLDEVMDGLVFASEFPVVSLEACRFTEELNLIVDEAQVRTVDSRREAWRGVFSEHLTPVVDSLHKATRLPLIILWENIAVRMNSYLRKAVQKNPDQAWMVQEVAAELREREGDVFGLERNPLAEYLAPCEALTTQVMRKTCCYYHKLQKEKELPYCLVCPVQ
ncbi:IucA/IucC family C-terminal-domain containing protein [Halobacillus salinus]|uniref:Aerobactin siderophore biosynthesis IucA/IucC-like C-terminal domain-containing protein n=1 Tax=Halobacillus salinus TaxID=192814 RepID=A0A4Z0GZX9_9BACI|nr:IucA/IucC family C-terminal-domain containing protein [Halobacillus salinus]TGB03772.1 hypothetical protein E4663_01840 [Halobacillus salinus]